MVEIERLKIQKFKNGIKKFLNIEVLQRKLTILIGQNACKELQTKEILN